MDLKGKRILISSCGGLGDLIMFTPALRQLKERFPSCHITFMTTEKHRDILSGLPYIDKVICIRRGYFLGRYRILPDFYGQDAVIFTDWQPQLLLFSWLFGIPVRAGIPKSGHRLCKCFTKQLNNNVFLYTHYAAKTNAMVFSEALDIELEGDMTTCDISQPQVADVQAVDALLADCGLSAEADYLLLMPFAGLDQRNWPLETARRFVELAEERFNLPVVVLGPPEKAEAARELSRYDLVGRTTILQLIELIKRSRCLVTPDSGPMHIAGALGTMVVPIFSKDLPSRWAPKKNCLPVTLSVECSPCDDDTARQCATLKCMRSITAEMVLQACEQCIALHKRNEKL